MATKGSEYSTSRRLTSLAEWAGTTRVLSPVRRLLRPCYDAAVRGLERRYQILVPLGQGQRIEVLDRIHDIRQERNLCMATQEAFFLAMAVARTAKVPGALAEIGVFQGASAKLICEGKGDRELFLFDTFEGLPEVEACDSTDFTKGQFAYSEASVREYLAGYPNVEVYKGLFPQSGAAIAGKQFSFVHLDVDLYNSTLASLGFFYPRLSPGAILLSHDYLASGVRQAFDEFFADKPEPVLELIGSQCAIVKTGQSSGRDRLPEG